jgi:hypothetical protein
LHFDFIADILCNQRGIFVMANVIPLFPDRPPVAQYIRAGITGHDQLEQLLESGRLINDGSLWLDRAIFDAAAAPRQVSLSALRDFVELGRPIVADGVAGLVGLATIAFGAAGGVAHGVGILERFDTRSWVKRPEKRSGGSAGTRALITVLDRQLKTKEVKAIAAATGGGRLISCADPKCCRRGVSDTLHDPKLHYIYQRRAPLEAISRVPESHRAQHYISQILAPADRQARMFNRLKIADLKLKKILDDTHRVEHLLRVLEHFHITTADDSRRASSPKLRYGNRPNSASAQR